jgi:glycine/D-amino acid oxidase-like deaminating enzyme
MRRRDFGKGCLGVALAAASRRAGTDRPKARVVVVGAGIIGASIAYYLARRGAHVIVCEKQRPAAGATSKSFAWINSTFSKQPRHYYELNRQGMDAWRRLDGELEGDLRVQWGGSVEWYPPGAEADQLRSDLHRHQAWGYGARVVEERELGSLVPGLRPGPVATASYSEHEGAVDPVHAVRVLLAHAESLGARVLYPCTVTRLDLADGRATAVGTSQGSYDADAVVLAGGVDTTALAALAGIRVPLKDSPGLLAHTLPLPRRVQRVVLAPGAHVVQRFDGRVVTGSSFGGTPSAAADEGAGRGLLREAAAFLPFLEGAALGEVTLGFRVMPEDELPVLGYPPGRPNLYVAAMHSGVTLSPLVGELAAREILDGVAVDALEPFRPSRFA